MKFRIVKIPEISGSKATIYSIKIDSGELTLFENFLVENADEYPSEVNNILQRLNTIGSMTGAREHFFKMHEGNFGDGVSALYDDPEKNLRLYCIRYDMHIIILGGGGPKPKNIRALQEDKKLLEENGLLRQISKKIYSAILDRSIVRSKNGLEFIGELAFDDEG